MPMLAILLSLTGLYFVSSISGAVAAIGNVGAGLGASAEVAVDVSIVFVIVVPI